MLEIKDMEECSKIFDPRQRYAISELFKAFTEGFTGDDVYTPENAGWMVYIESKEDCGAIDDLIFSTVCMWEGVSYFGHEKMYEIIILYNNEFVKSYFIPEWNIGLSTENQIQVFADANEITKYSSIAERLPHLVM